MTNLCWVSSSPPNLILFKISDTMREKGEVQKMNSRLVDSLVNLIESLDSEDYTLLLQKLTERTIQKHPNICQGYARIRNTRIPVWTLVSFRQQGANEQEILENYPSLTLNDLTAAWFYYQQNSAEIDQIINEEIYV